jgi:hypothetical protein
MGFVFQIHHKGAACFIAQLTVFEKTNTSTAFKSLSGRKVGRHYLMTAYSPKGGVIK